MVLASAQHSAQGDAAAAVAAAEAIGKPAQGRAVAGLDPHAAHAGAALEGARALGTQAQLAAKKTHAAAATGELDAQAAVGTEVAHRRAALHAALARARLDAHQAGQALRHRATRQANRRDVSVAGSGVHLGPARPEAEHRKPPTSAPSASDAPPQNPHRVTSGAVYHSFR